MRRPIAAILFFASSIGWPSLATADSSAQDKAQADALFREGRSLMSAGSTSQACGKFAESQRLDPAPGTLMNLALCHEKEGKTASAWAELNEVAEIPGDDRSRAPFAKARAADLEKRLAHVRLRVELPVPGQVVSLDGRELGAAAWGSAIPVDPGQHRVASRGPGRESWERVVDVGPGPNVTETVVPALPPVVAAPVPTPLAPPSAPATEPPVRTHTLRNTGLVLGGVGVVGLAAGTFFGIRTFAQKSDADALCPTNACASNARVRELDDGARTSATVSTIAFVVGSAALVAGSILFLVGQFRTTRSTRGHGARYGWGEF